MHRTGELGGVRVGRSRVCFFGQTEVESRRYAGETDEQQKADEIEVFSDEFHSFDFVE